MSYLQENIPEVALVEGSQNPFPVEPSPSTSLLPLETAPLPIKSEIIDEKDIISDTVLLNDPMEVETKPVEAQGVIEEEYEIVEEEVEGGNLNEGPSPLFPFIPHFI